MRADAKVYALQDTAGQIISLNASLKNLMEKMVATRKFSRSCPDRKTTMATLKTGNISIHQLKTGDQYTITYRDLGIMDDTLFPETKPLQSASIFKPGELDLLITEDLTNDMTETYLEMA